MGRRAWGAITLMGVLAVAEAAGAQVVPDRTLGSERSRVGPGRVQGEAAERIRGGARRGGSLFHSFRDFNIGAGERVYFAPADGVQTILSRVTGNNASEIFGTLGVEGSANLFLLNPNGIVFGPNARLDLNGAFVATTAEGFVFSEGFTFGTQNPTAPPLLRVSVPMGLQYGRQPGAIRSQAALAVDSGQSLVLAGGQVNLTNAVLFVTFPQGGRIELGSVGEAGTVGLTQRGNLFHLGFPEDLERSKISLSNSILQATAADGGSIALTGRGINLRNESNIRAGIAAGYGSRGSQAGDITLDATGIIQLNRSSLIANTVAAATDTEAAGVGHAGNLQISARSLWVRDGVLNTSTLGDGNAGNILIQADHETIFDHGDVFSSSGGILNDQAIRAAGQGGDIQIRTGSLSVQNRAQLVSNTLGNGDAGNIRIQAEDQVIFDDGKAFSRSGGFFNQQVVSATGQGGDIQISTGSLRVRNGAQLIANTLDQGNAGSILIQAEGPVIFEGQDTGASSRSGTVSINQDVIRATGQGGDVRISADSLWVRNGAQLLSNTLGSGDAGRVIIHANDQVVFDQGDAFSSSGAILNDGRVIQATGQGGNIQIAADVLWVSDGSQLDASTSGSGDAGNILLQANDQVVFDRGNVFSRSGRTSADQLVSRGRGAGGNIQIATGSLWVRRGARLVSSTLGRGNAGNIIIQAESQVVFDGGSAASRSGGTVGRTSRSTTSGNTISQRVIRARGNGGDIQIFTNLLQMRNRAQLRANTLGGGDAGNITIQARDQVIFEGQETGASSRSGSVLQDGQVVQATGQGGDVQISTGLLTLRDGAVLTAESLGNSSAGSLILDANEAILDNGTLTTENRARNGGNITLARAQLLGLVRGSRITTSASENGNGGDINLTADLIASSAPDNNDITANAFNGRGGAVNITGQLAGIDLVSRDELQARLDPTNPRQLDPDNLDSNDITAISQNAPTLSGQVTVSRSDVDPSRGLIELPTVPVDASRLIAQTCPNQIAAGDDRAELSEFVISGRGGLPPAPEDSQDEDALLTDWATLDGAGDATLPEAAIQESVRADLVLVEATGWVVNAAGKVELVGEASPKATPAQCPS